MRDAQPWRDLQPTGIIVERTPRQISGDPFIVRDGDRFVMYFFRSGVAPAVAMYFKTAKSLDGPWTEASPVAGMDSFCKMAVLVDEQGAPVHLEGKFHAYAAYFNGALADKEIFHFTADALTGAWMLGAKVIPRGPAGSKDESNADAPYAVYSSGKTRLWYMAAPAQAQGDYGLAERILMATADTPGGPFTKDYADVIAPADSPAWDHGWLGGAQVRRVPGGYLMVYNAGHTRPATPGAEPDGSAIGMARADSLDGPWTKEPGNPRLQVSDDPPALEKMNVWRGHLAWDGRWYLFYNVSRVTETITFAR